MRYPPRFGESGKIGWARLTENVLRIISQNSNRLFFENMVLFYGCRLLVLPIYYIINFITAVIE
jgi:hypothetical protein